MQSQNIIVTAVEVFWSLLTHAEKVFIAICVALLGAILAVAFYILYLW